MKKRQKRSFRSKYLLILLLISAIVFISSTYAWFTTNRTVTVSTIDVHVQTVSGIQISVDGINWKSSITKDDLLGATSTYSANINTLPEELEPVSTGLTFDASNAGQLEMFYGKVEADETGVYKLTATKDAPKTDGTHFIVFDIFLKTTEGLGKFVKRSLKESFTESLFTKLSYLIARKPIKLLSKAMDYKSYGGALFLGVKKPVVKAHGSSDEILFEFTIKQAEQFVNNKTVENLISEFEKGNNSKTE